MRPTLMLCTQCATHHQIQIETKGIPYDLCCFGMRFKRENIQAHYSHVVYINSKYVHENLSVWNSINSIAQEIIFEAFEHGLTRGLY